MRVPTGRGWELDRRHLVFARRLVGWTCLVELVTLIVALALGAFEIAPVVYLVLLGSAWLLNRLTEAAYHYEDAEESPQKRRRRRSTRRDAR